MTEERRINFLQALVNETITLKQCKDDALQEKRHMRVLDGMRWMGGFGSEAEVWAAFPNPVVEKTLLDFSKHFSKERPMEKLPISFANHMRKLLSEMERMKNASAIVQAGEAGADGFESFEFKRVLLAPEEFRGFKLKDSSEEKFTRDEILLQSFAQINDAETLTPTFVKSVHRDVMEDSFWSTFLAGIQPQPWKQSMVSL